MLSLSVVCIKYAFPPSLRGFGAVADMYGFSAEKREEYCHQPWARLPQYIKCFTHLTTCCRCVIAATPIGRVAATVLTRPTRSPLSAACIPADRYTPSFEGLKREAVPDAGKPSQAVDLLPLLGRVDNHTYRPDRSRRNRAALSTALRLARQRAQSSFRSSAASAFWRTYAYAVCSVCSSSTACILRRAFGLNM